MVDLKFSDAGWASEAEKLLSQSLPFTFTARDRDAVRIRYYILYMDDQRASKPSIGFVAFFRLLFSMSFSFHKIFMAALYDRWSVTFVSETDECFKAMFTPRAFRSDNDQDMPIDGVT